jgi:hypothetical protein
LSPWQKILERPDPCGHLVQFYDRHEALVENVGLFLQEGFRRSDAMIAVTSEPHRHMFRERLMAAGCDVDGAVDSGQLLLLDADETLPKLLRRGVPDWSLLEPLAEDMLAQVRPRGTGGLRFYGEMVMILWKAGQYSAAIRLEEFWNRLQARSSFSLFCGYEVDVLGEAMHPELVEALLARHSHCVPATNGMLEPAIRRALFEVLGSRVAEFESKARVGVRDTAIMPRGEAMTLAIRKILPDCAETILTKARGYYEHSRNLQVALTA